MSDFEVKIYRALRQAAQNLFGLELDETVLVVETPKDPKLGDYATSAAMKLARTLRKNPMEIAASLVGELEKLLPEAESITAARPGFINFKLKNTALAALIDQVIEAGEHYGESEAGKGKKVLVEWVSANPTGDLHCGHARNAAWGDCICRMMEASGWEVLREYYVNDAGNQIVMLGESLTARYFEHFGRDYPLPENGYHAEDVKQIAEDIAARDGDKWLDAEANERLEYFMREGKRRELEKIDRDLKLYGVRIDSWMHETFFYENDRQRIRECLQRMEDMGLTYEKDGALWFRSTAYGDEKDRVLRKSDGTLSYMTPDIANHVHKVERGYPFLVDLWGADHHSYVTRMQAALKALGYPAGTIASKYLLYAGSAAFLGCMAGFLLGSALIPWIVWVAYGVIYDYAKLDFYLSPLIGALSLAAVVLGTLFVTWLACRLELREKPAELIRPKAPKAGKRILLERITPLWKRLGFLAKVSLRNAFRYPVRVMMMLLGIGGCTALLVAGFGAKDSVAHISDYQYGEIFLYDLAVSIDPDKLASDAQAERLWSGQAEDLMTWQEPVTLTAGDYTKETHAIAAGDTGLGDLIRLYDEHGALPFPREGEAVVTEKIADVLHLRVGDRFDMRLDDGTACTLRVSGVCKNYLGHYIYCSTASIGFPRSNTALLRTTGEMDAARLGAKLRGEEGVRYVTLTQQERESMEQSFESINLILLLVVICSAALAFITLYNLTNINIIERTREIATVKVLGFTPGETAEYVLRENLLLSFLGALLGLFLGKGLHSLIIQALVVENMTCEKHIEPKSYALALGLTLVFTALTNLVMRGKLEKVNMAESLKSVE